MIDIQSYIEILDLDIDSVLCRSIKFRYLLFEDRVHESFSLEPIIESCYKE